MAESIVMAKTAGDYSAYAGLIREFVDWCRARYAEDKWFVDAALSHQSLESEMETLSTTYSPPKGKALLANRDGQICGCVAYRVLSDGVCEMKRLFVPKRFQGNGTGRRLCEALITITKHDGFELMRLDTGNLLKEAISLYQALGFKQCEPYNEYPIELMRFLVFMELPLSGGPNKNRV